MASWAPGEARARRPSATARPQPRLAADGRLPRRRTPVGRLVRASAPPGPRLTTAKLGNAKGAGGTVQKLGTPGRRSSWRARPRVGAARHRRSCWSAPWSARPAARRPSGPPTSRTRRRSSRTRAPSATAPRRVIAPRAISLKNLKKTKCVRVRVTVTEPARVLVAIFSGRKSIRLFGQKVVPFTAAGTKVVCVRVPFRAKTFDVAHAGRRSRSPSARARPRRPGEPRPRS